MPYNLYINGIDLQLLLWCRFLVNISSQALTTVIQTVLTAYLQYIYTFLHSIAFSVHISPLYNSQLRSSWWGLHAKDSVRKSASVPGLKKIQVYRLQIFHESTQSPPWWWLRPTMSLLQSEASEVSASWWKCEGRKQS